MIQKLGRASLIRLAFGVLVALIGLILQHPLAALVVLAVFTLPFAWRWLSQMHHRKVNREQELINYASSIAKQRQFERVTAGTPPAIPLQHMPSAGVAPTSDAPITEPPPSPQAQLQQFDFDFSGTNEVIKTTPDDQLEWQSSAQTVPVAVRPRANPEKKHYFDTETAVNFAELGNSLDTRSQSAQTNQRIVGSREGYTIVENLDAEVNQRFALMRDQNCLYQGDYAGTRAALSRALAEGSLTTP